MNLKIEAALKYAEQKLANLNGTARSRVDPTEAADDIEALASALIKVIAAVREIGAQPTRIDSLSREDALWLYHDLGLAVAESMGPKLPDAPAASPLPKNGPEPSIAALPDTDAMLLCAHGCGEVPHRFRPSPEAGPYWRCSECGEITPAIKVRTIGGMIDQRALFAERYGDEGGPTEPVNESEVGP